MKIRFFRDRWAVVVGMGVLLACVALGPGHSRAGEPAPADSDPLNVLSNQEQEAGWRLLFDGQTTAGWRNYGKPGIGSGWKVVDGALARVGKQAGDIITLDQFAAFELSLEYNISEAGNSGIMFHVTEEGEDPWETGPEVQIIDNVRGHDPQKSGWLYDLYRARTDATRPAGQWNQMRIIITPEKCEHYLNGVKYVQYVKGSKGWDERVAASKFREMPRFGKATGGHICLQDHGNPVSFRNIKIRPITAK